MVTTLYILPLSIGFPSNVALVSFLSFTFNLALEEIPAPPIRAFASNILVRSSPFTSRNETVLSNEYISNKLRRVICPLGRVALCPFTFIMATSAPLGKCLEPYCSMISEVKLVSKLSGRPFCINSADVPTTSSISLSNDTLYLSTSACISALVPCSLFISTICPDIFTIEYSCDCLSDCL